jgi:hypothetical protein
MKRIQTMFTDNQNPLNCELVIKRLKINHILGFWWGKGEEEMRKSKEM